MCKAVQEIFHRREHPCIIGSCRKDDFSIAESICDCFRKWSGDVYAHTVVCAPSLPRGLSLLQAGNRVTVLLSDGGAQSCGGVTVVPFSRKNMAQELEYLEI